MCALYSVGFIKEIRLRKIQHFTRDKQVLRTLLILYKQIGSLSPQIESRTKGLLLNKGLTFEL